MTFCYDYPRPAVTTDCVLFAEKDGEINVLLIERVASPYKNYWAFPGGFLNMDEDAETGAKRELFEETGIHEIEIEQLHTFTKVDRDPRGRVISIVFFAKIDMEKHKPKAGDDAENARWFPLSEIPTLAFDHDDVLRIALLRL